MGMEHINESMNQWSMKFPKGNTNESLKSMSSNGDVIYTENTADKLVKKFNAPGSRQFFLKCAWNLTPAFIWDTVEISQKKTIKKPLNYFVKVCSNKMSS